ncbi:MAG TPA: hypothetical protein VIJ85_10485 [Rhizomicrobium sp.]
MRMVALLAGLSIAAAIILPAAADDSKKADSEPGTHVEMPYLIAPLASGDTLLAYAYISCIITASSPAAAMDIRGRIAFIQDAFVRDVNMSSIGKATDPKTVDATTLTARLLADAQKATKPGLVVGLKLIQIQIRPLRPDAQQPDGPS